MNLFNFTANFESYKACRIHFKEQRDMIGVEYKYGSKEHFGFRVVVVMNVKSVEVEFLYEAKL